MLKAFREFVPSAAAPESEYKELSALRRVADEMGSSEALAAIDSLESILRRPESVQGFSPRMEPYVRAGLKRELVLHLDGRQASLMSELETDLQVRRAVEIVQNEERYNELLKGS